MSKQNTNQRATHHENSNSQTHKYGHIFMTGFCGGILTSFVAYVISVFDFIPEGPGMIFQFFGMQGMWIQKVTGHLVAIVMFGILSIILTWIYYALCRRLLHPLYGVVYGFVLWSLIFLGWNTLDPGQANVSELGWSTNIVYVCLFVFYGLFTGHSVAYQYAVQHNLQQATESEG